MSRATVEAARRAVSKHLSDGDTAYHQRVSQQLSAAQAAWSSWGAHLTQRYQLGPADSVSAAGEIERGAAAVSKPVSARQRLLAEASKTGASKNGATKMTVDVAAPATNAAPDDAVADGTS